MIMLSFSVANNYAVVLFKSKNFDNDEIFNKFTEFCSTVKKNPLIVEFLNKYFVSNEEKKKTFYEIFNGFVDYKDFFDLIFYNGRAEYIPLIVDSFIDLYRKNKGIGRIKIVSNVKVDGEKIDLIKEKVRKDFNFSVVDVETEIKNDIIGGFILYVNNYEYDFSIKGFIENFHRYLHE